jgi:hypothetical protein
MKKYFIGFLSILLLLASIFGTQAKKPKAQRPERGSDRTMWV